MEQTLLHIFVNAIWAGSIIPFADQNALFAVLGFRTPPTAYAVIVAAVGNMIGFAFNWYIAHTIAYKIHHKKHPHLTTEEQELNGLRPLTPVEKYGWLALLLVWIPLGNFLTVAAGALSMRLDKTILTAGFAMLVYYVYQAGYLG